MHNYERYIVPIPRVFILLIILLLHLLTPLSKGVVFIYSTPLAICNNKRISRNKVITKKGWLWF